MKLTLNCEWGGWGIPDELEDEFFGKNLWFNPELRFNEKLIQWLENHPEESDLRVFELPEGTTDYKIIDYDGQEDCVYALDGKLYWLRGFFDS